MTDIFQKRHNNFNLLRLILATLVIVGHSPELIDGDRHREPLTQLFGSISFGELAVDGFFILSGYLITQSWDQSLSGSNYLIKRVARIFPGFAVAALISAFVVGPIFGGNPNYLQEFKYVTFLTHMTVLTFQVTPAVYPGYPYAIINAPMWTIHWEFLCYLMVFFLGSLRLLNQKIFVPLLYVACAGIFAYTASRLTHAVTNIPPRLPMLFLAGMSFYICRDLVKYKFSFFGLAIVLCVLALKMGLMSELFLTVPFAYVLFYVSQKHFVFTEAFNRLPDVSFGTYLYAWPIQKILVCNLQMTSPIMVTLITIPLAYAVGYLSWMLVERHFLSWKIKSLSLNLRADTPPVR